MPLSDFPQMDQFKLPWSAWVFHEHSPIETDGIRFDNEDQHGHVHEVKCDIVADEG